MLVQRRLGFIAIDTICMFIKSNTVATYSKITTSSLCESNSDSEDESENSDESL